MVQSHVQDQTETNGGRGRSRTPSTHTRSSTSTIHSLIDENHKLEVSRHNEYKEKLTSDYPKATTAHYHFLSRQIITDLERHIENISPPTTDAGFYYRAMKKRLGHRRTQDSQRHPESRRRLQRMGRLPSRVRHTQRRPTENSPEGRKR